MKRTINLYLLAGLVLLFSCELDNYPAPDIILEGKVIDATTGETIQTRQPDGIKIRLLEEGYENPVPYDFWTKSDGSFRNTRIFAAKYRAVAVEGPFEQSSVEELSVDLTGNQTVVFEVEPFVRLSEVEISKTSGGIRASYKISQTTSTKKILKSMLIVGSSDILHQTTTNKLSSAENSLEDIANKDIGFMSFVDEVGNLTPGKTYFARVAVLTDNTLNRYNYSPIIEIEL
jgi:hypothetical protein